jgi:hypothetical protein
MGANAPISQNTSSFCSIAIPVFEAETRFTGLAGGGSKAGVKDRVGWVNSIRHR